MTTNEATGIIRCALESSRARLIRHGGTALDESWCIDKPLAAMETLQSERDEAFRVRDLAREASNRDLEAKRAAEAEREEYHQMALTAIAERNTAYELRDSRIAEVNSLEAELAEARKALDDRSDASWMRRVDKLTEALADLWLVTPVDTSKASKASAYERAAALLRGEEKS